MPEKGRVDRVPVPVRRTLLLRAPVLRPPRVQLRLQGRGSRGHRERKPRGQGREDRPGLIIKFVEMKPKTFLNFLGKIKINSRESFRGNLCSIIMARLSLGDHHRWFRLRETVLGAEETTERQIASLLKKIKFSLIIIFFNFIVFSFLLAWKMIKLL